MGKAEDANIPVPPNGEIVIYQSQDGKVNLDIHLKNETVWMAKSEMAELFQCSVDNIKFAFEKHL